MKLRQFIFQFKSIKNFLFVFYNVLLLIHVEAQSENQIKFQQLSVQEGLSNTHVNDITQDRKGFLWISTFMGINRFDGYDFSLYMKNPTDSSSITSSAIYTFFEDKEGNKWFGTSNGLNLYQPETDNFISFQNNPGDPLSISNNIVRSIRQDTNNILWIGTYGGGLNRFDPATKIFTRYIHDPNDPQSIPSNKVNIIFIDSRNNFWVGTEQGGLSLFLPNEGKFRPITASSKYKALNKIDIVNNLFEDKNGLLWICTWYNGVYSFDAMSGEIVGYMHEPNNPNSLSHNTVRDITQDWQGDYWIATFGGGLNKLSSNKKQFTTYTKDPGNIYSLPNNSLWSLFIDRTGILWIGTYGNGLAYFDFTRQKFAHYQITPKSETSLNNNAVSSFVENGEEIIVGTLRGGTTIFDRKKNVFRPLKIKEERASNNVLTLFKDKKGRIWIGTGDGLVRYNPIDKTSIHYLNDPKNPSSIGFRSVSAITESPEGDIWMTIWGNSLNKLAYTETLKDNPKEAIFKTLPTIFKDTTIKFNFDNPSGLYIDSQRTIWIASSGGLLKYSIPDNEFTLEFIELTNCILPGDSGTFWIGTTGGGLIYYNPKTKKQTIYNLLNGLPNNTVTAMLADNNGNLWLSTEAGLTRFNIRTKQVSNFNVRDGLQGNEFLVNSSALLRSGEMIFGGSNGFNIFHPDSLKPISVKPLIALTDFRILNKSVHPGEKFSGKTILKEPIYSTSQIVLTHHENTFSIEFAALSYNSPLKNKYAYRLEGFDKDWNYADAKERMATYTNLEGGKYSFRVIGANSDGTWNTEGITLSITILPPYWKTIWFRVLIILLLTGSVLGIFFNRTRRIRNQNSMLEQLVAKRTEEINQKNNMLQKQTDYLNEVNTLLEERQQQIGEQAEELRVTNEHLEEVNSMKDKFFSIIAHDLKNPFNTLLGFTELLETNYTNWEEEKRFRIVKIIKDSAKSAYALLENLLTWSRAQRGVIKFNPTQLNLNGLVEGAILIVKNQAQAKDITIVFSRLEREINISADGEMLDTVLRNLLSNAIKFTHKNGIINIDVQTDANQICVSVKDNGTGISIDTLEKIFRIDNRLQSSGTENESGTGLGLLLCKEFIDAHGGKIWVESKLDEGSTFTFTIPKSIKKLKETATTNHS